MKIGFTIYFKDREQGKIRDEIEGKIITIDEVHSFYLKGEKKVLFKCEEDEKHYFYMPDGYVDIFDDETIDKVNNGDYIKGIFKKVTTANERECWNFEDVE